MKKTKAVPIKTQAGSKARKSVAKRQPKAAAPVVSAKIDVPAAPSPNATAGGKAAVIADLIRRPGGAALSELMAATGWQAHSVRGIISGVLRKKLGLSVQVVAGVGGKRAYRIGA